MNARDVLRYGQLTVIGTLGQVPADMIDEPGACGVWSIRQIMAHLASYEVVLVDVIASLAGEAETPHLDAFTTQGPAFNDLEVEARNERDLESILDELQRAHDASLAALDALPPERVTQPGFLPWYGEEYSLDDLIVYQYYGHKREHAAQIEAFRDRQSQLA